MTKNKIKLLFTKTGKKFRRLFRKSIGFLPEHKRFQIYRDHLKIKLSLPEKLVFKLAETGDELSQAFAILHDAYVDEGYMAPHPSGMRITRYHALPSSSTLIVLWDNKIVGTVSIIRDSVLGFPSDKIIDTSELKKDGTRVAEISSLAIHKDYRRRSGYFLFPLLKFLYEYCMRYFGVDIMLISVNPKHVDFYESILYFKKLDQQVAEYDFVNGAPAVLLYLDLRKTYDKFAINYGDKPPSKNLFNYFYKEKFNNFTFPDRQYFKISDPVMTPEMLDHFFNRKTDLFSTLSDSERDIITGIYKHSEYANILTGSKTKSNNFNHRRHNRYEVNCKGRIALYVGKRIIQMTLQDVSLNGIKALLEDSIRFGDILKFDVEIGEFNVADLSGYPAWTDQNRTYGFKLKNWTKNWQEFINYMELELNKETIHEPAAA